MRHAIAPFRSFGGAVTLLALFAAGCNGGSLAAPPIGGSTATPAPPPVALPASATATIAVGATPASGSLGPVLGGYSSTIGVPAGSNAATLTVTLAAAQPAGTPAVQTVKRRPQTIGGPGIAPIAFLTISSSVTVTLGATPGFSFTVPAGAASLGQPSYVALYDPSASPQPGWTTFAGPGTVSGDTIAFAGASGSRQLQSGVTYDIVFFSVPSALPTPSPSPTATATPAPTATPVTSAQHLYTAVAMANGTGIAKFALPLTSSSTPMVTAPAPLTASDSTIGSSLAVNAAHVIYTDVVHDAFFVLDQPIGSNSQPSAMFCYSGCGDHQNTHSLMTVALSPFGFLAGTDTGAGGPVASSVLHFYNAPFSNQTVSASSQQLTHPAAGLAYDSAGNLFTGGSMFTSSGDVEEFASNVLLVHITAPIFVTSVAVNASQLAVAGSTGSPCAGTVLIYTLPLTSSSSPSATITNGVGGNCRYFVALDAAGYLYVSGTAPGLSVYAPPLSNASSPSATLATGNANQVVIGP